MKKYKQIDYHLQYLCAQGVNQYTKGVAWYDSWLGTWSILYDKIYEQVMKPTKAEIKNGRP